MNVVFLYNPTGLDFFHSKIKALNIYIKKNIYPSQKCPHLNVLCPTLQDLQFESPKMKHHEHEFVRVPKVDD